MKLGPLMMTPRRQGSPLGSPQPRNPQRRPRTEGRVDRFQSEHREALPAQLGGPCTSSPLVGAQWLRFKSPRRASRDLGRGAWLFSPSLEAHGSLSTRALPLGSSQRPRRGPGSVCVCVCCPAQPWCPWCPTPGSFARGGEDTAGWGQWGAGGRGLSCQWGLLSAAGHLGPVASPSHRAAGPLPARLACSGCQPRVCSSAPPTLQLGPWPAL